MHGDFFYAKRIIGEKTIVIKQIRGGFQCLKSVFIVPMMLMKDRCTMYPLSLQTKREMKHCVMNVIKNGSKV